MHKKLLFIILMVTLLPLIQGCERRHCAEVRDLALEKELYLKCLEVRDSSPAGCMHIALILSTTEGECTK